MKCKVQWITLNGVPTPDDNEAIGLALCDHVYADGRRVEGKPIPICEDHLKRMPRGQCFDHMGGFSVWDFVRFYWTILIPPSRYPTKWHAPDVTVSRGAFRCKKDAHVWAALNLDGRPYTVRKEPTLCGM